MIPTALKNTGLEISSQSPLAPYTYMKVGGPAEYLSIATSSKDIAQLVKAAYKEKLAITILGGGSNVLISDKGLDGLVIINRTQEVKIVNSDKNLLKVESGVIVNQLVNYCIDHSLGGLEEFLGIPGTVGGAIFNNSHHLSHLIGDYIKSVEVIDSSGEIKIYSQKESEFAYDYSIFQKTKDIILSAEFQLKPADQDYIRKLSLSALKRRRDTQPLEFPSSGCMFKNIGKEQALKLSTPEKNGGAGYLIDQAGLKGYQIGGAKISEKHANFIINTGTASSKDIQELSDYIIQIIKDKFNVTLEREVFFIGK